MCIRDSRRSPQRSALKHASALQISDRSVRNYGATAHTARAIVDLKRNIQTEVAAISPEVLRRVMHGLPLRLEECVEHEGHHLKNVIFKK